jgi:CCR4-NOT transcription complex subunit 9
VLFGAPQVDDTDVINFLLSTEIIPLCLRTMEIGSELSKTVATFIVQKILLDDVGACWGCCMSFSLCSCQPAC